jgi:hypothetical protein
LPTVPGVRLPDFRALISSQLLYNCGMTETDPRAKEKPAARKRRGEYVVRDPIDVPIEADVLHGGPERDLDLPGLIREVYSRLSSGAHLPVSGIDQAGDHSQALGPLEAALIRSGLEQALAPPEGEEEVTQIYQRIDRELAVEEARADRLLRLYGL